MGHRLHLRRRHRHPATSSSWSPSASWSSDTLDSDIVTALTPEPVVGLRAPARPRRQVAQHREDDEHRHAAPPRGAQRAPRDARVRRATGRPPRATSSEHRDGDQRDDHEVAGQRGADVAVGQVVDRAQATAAGAARSPARRSGRSPSWCCVRVAEVQREGGQRQAADVAAGASIRRPRVAGGRAARRARSRAGRRLVVAHAEPVHDHEDHAGRDGERDADPEDGMFTGSNISPTPPTMKPTSPTTTAVQAAGVLPWCATWAPVV